jgi:hypothetical protein
MEQILELVPTLLILGFVALLVWEAGEMVVSYWRSPKHGPRFVMLSLAGVAAASLIVIPLPFVLNALETEGTCPADVTAAVLTMMFAWIATALIWAMRIAPTDIPLPVWFTRPGIVDIALLAIAAAAIAYLYSTKGACLT